MTSRATTPVLSDLQWRGLVTQSTDLDELAKALESPQTFYVGFDPTGPSLHVGHLVQVLTARRLQQAGHRPLALVGGATGLIGDPRMSSERSLIDADVVAGWADRIRSQVEPFLEFDGPAAATMVNNLDWTGPMTAIALLRDVGKHFSVNRMLDKESVKARLNGSGISFTEFTYQVLQANDYLELYRRHGCMLQFGGNDQWGNITAGVELVRRAAAGAAHAFTTPLVTKADGTKFGKSEGGSTPWLDPTMTSPYALYQFWLNTDDRDVETFLRYFSFRDREEIQDIVRRTAERPAARVGQHALAEEITSLLHGVEECGRVVAASQALFGRGELRDLDAATLAASTAEIPSARIEGEMPPIVDLLVLSGLVSSRGEARRTVREGGAYLNNVKVTDEAMVPSADDVLHGRWLLLRRGKRSLAVAELEGAGRA